MTSNEKKHVINIGFRVAILMLLTLGFLMGCKEEVVEKELIRPVKAIKVGDVVSLNGRSFPGRALATEEVNLGFEVGGSLIERPVNKGDKVRKGQLLARLDPRDFKNELEAAKAERDRAMAYRDRIAEALKARAVAKQDLTDAEAKLKEAIARVNIKRKALTDAVIYAPFDGVVAATFVENFQRVRAKEIVLRLLDISKIEFTVDIPENLISYVTYVKKVWIEYDAFSGRKIPAKVKEVGTEASETTRTYPVTLIHKQPEDIKILPGMAGESSVKVQIPDNFSEKGIEIPSSAVFSSGDIDKSYVWVIDEGAELVNRREIKIGKPTSFGIMVREGLSPGEWIATAGVHYLSNGQKVRILGQSSKEKAK